MSDIVEETPGTGQKFAAEVLGTFVLVFFGVGTALMSGGDYVATALGFGLAVVVMGYTLGRVSGAHLNPALTLGAALGGRLAWRATPVYLSAQVLGGLLAGLALLVLMQGFAGFTAAGDGLGANSYGDQGSGYAWWAAFGLELLLTAVLVWVALGVTDPRNELHAAMGPLAVGLAYAMVHLASMGATGTSANPARSLGVGVFAGLDAVLQLWLFILAPLLGAVVAGVSYPLLFGHGAEPVAGSGLSIGGGRRHEQAGFAPPAGYEQQWHPGGPAPWQPQPPAQHWGAPPAPPYSAPTPTPYDAPSPYPPQQWSQPPAAHDEQWGRTQQPARPGPGQQPPAPGQWGRPEDDDEDGRTQIRRPD